MAKKFKPKLFEQEKIPIEVDSEMIENMFYYSLNNEGLVTKKGLYNVKTLLDLIDESIYEEDDIDSYQYILITRAIITCRVVDRFNKPKLIYEKLKDDETVNSFDTLMDYFRQLLDELEESDEDDLITLEPEEVNYINKYVEERLTYAYIYKYKSSFINLFNSLNKRKISRLNSEFTNLIQHCFSDVMRAKADDEAAINDFDLFNESKREFVIKRTIEEYNRPNNRINTGLQSLNTMLGGGLENGRFYLACGAPKSWKSGFLLQLLIWTCKYNQDFVLKDKNKRPAVLYLTQENSVKETINRLYLHLTGKKIKDVNEQEANLTIYKELGCNGVNPIIRYRPNKSISTVDLNAMIDEIEADGNEVILLIQDYTKRIRSSNYNPDLRIELG